MGEPAAKKARGGADGLVPTIREFLPWHVIEKKMAARAEGLIHDDAAPDSGVYASGEHAAAVIAANQNEALPGEPVVPANSGALTYQVYTLADLEKRGINADLSVSSTRMSMVMTAPKPNPWADVARAAITIVRLSKTWVLTPRPKPSLKDAFRAPLVALAFELRQATKTIDWKKVATYAGATAGVFLFLLFAVVTVADLTDDLKPARTATTQSGDSYTNQIIAEAHPKVVAPQSAAPAPSAASTGDGLEVTSEAAPVPVRPAPVTKTPASKKRGTAKKKPRSGEVFNP